MSNSRVRAPVLFVVMALSVSSAGQNAPAAVHFASDTIPAERLAAYSDLAQRWMQEYLRIDTTNPPGNETRATTWMKRILDAEGIENRVFNVVSGRDLLWAKVPAAKMPKKRPIILLNHTDVVTSDASHWTHPPFSGAIDSGVIYGRGAQDMKNEGLAQLVVLVMLGREKPLLDRDVIFIATPDEEADSSGVDWVMHGHTNLLEDAEFLINEGGVNLEENGRVTYVGVELGEKSPYWLHLVAHGTPGHGSRPLPDSAPNRLVRALNRIIAWEPPLQLLPSVEMFLQRTAAVESGQRAVWYRNPRQAMKNPRFRAYVSSDPGIAYMFRDTVSLTQMGGAQQTNVIPSDAWANLDVRLLPGEDPDRFEAEIKRIIHDANVSIEHIGTFHKPNASPADTELFRSIERVCARYFPGSPVTPRMESGYTESQRYRELGIVSYGFNTYAPTEAENHSQHGNDERVKVEQVRRAPRILYDVVTEVGSK